MAGFPGLQITDTEIDHIPVAPSSRRDRYQLAVGVIPSQFEQTKSHLHTAFYVFTCIYMYLHVCIYIYMYVCMSVCMYVCTYVRMYVCMYVRAYVCTYVCILYVHLLRIDLHYQTPSQGIQHIPAKADLPKLDVPACACPGPGSSLIPRIEVWTTDPQKMAVTFDHIQVSFIPRHLESILEST